jgi:hypothetical protein
MTVLETARVRLRRMTLDDLDDLLVVFSEITSQLVV